MQQLKEHVSRGLVHSVIALLAAACFAAISLSCGKEDRTVSTELMGGSATIQPGTPVEGIDPLLWAKLTAELERVLEEEGTARRANAVATGQGSIVPDLSLHRVPPDNHYTWTYRNQGDYDLNGEVTIADLTPIGLHFGKNTLSPDWQQAQLADGDCNGEVNVADVTPIGQNFGGRVDGYELQRRSTASEPFEVLAEFPFVAGSPTTGLYPEYERLGPLVLGNPEYRVVPYIGNGGSREYGPASEIFRAGYSGQTNWSMYRGGPFRDGQARVSGPDSAAEVWTVEVQGFGLLGEPISGLNGEIYVATTQDSWFNLTAANPGFLYCIAPDGKINWSFKTKAGILMTPATSDRGRVMFGDLSGTVYSLAPDGKQLWRAQLPGIVAFNSPLAANDGSLYIVTQTLSGSDITGSTLFKLSPDGQTDWSKPLADTCFAAPFYNAVGQVTVVDETGELNSWDVNGNQMYKFWMPDELGGSSYLGKYVAFRGSTLAYITDDPSFRINGYDNSIQQVVDLGENPVTGISFNSAGQLVLGSVTLGLDPALRLNLYQNSSEVWDMNLSGVQMSGIAIDSSDRMYFCAYNWNGAELVVSGINCVLPNQTIAWYYPLEDKVALTISIADENLLVCCVAPAFGPSIGNSTVIGIKGS